MWKLQLELYLKNEGRLDDRSTSLMISQNMGTLMDPSLMGTLIGCHIVLPEILALSTGISYNLCDGS